MSGGCHFKEQRHGEIDVGANYLQSFEMWPGEKHKKKITLNGGKL